VIFTPARLAGAFSIDLERREDDRGFFARSYCRKEFEAHGLKADVAQCNTSYNRRRGTLRGLHYQVAPRAEAKVVHCTAGAVYDVILDLRPESPTFHRWEAFELTVDNRRMLYVPEGFAHGFQTLSDHTSVLYLMMEFYSPEHARGVRWNDPAFGIDWPIAEPIVSRRDAGFPLWPEGRT
jgi:dTDP-4-dehydrorhamnose 3,5-epimerase